MTIVHLLGIPHLEVDALLDAGAGLNTCPEELVIIIFQEAERSGACLCTLYQWKVALQKPDGGERLVVLQARESCGAGAQRCLCIVGHRQV